MARLVVFNPKANEVIILNNCFSSNSQLLFSYNIPGDSFEFVDIFGYKNKFVICKQTFGEGYHDIRLVNMNTGTVTLLEDYYDAFYIFQHSTLPNVLCILVTSDIIEFYDIDTSQKLEIRQLNIKLNESYNVMTHFTSHHVIGDYFFGLNVQRQLSVYKLRFTPSESTPKNPRLAHFSDVSTLVNFDKKTGQLILASNNSVALFQVCNWQESTGETISFSLVTKLSITYVEKAIKLIKGFGYDCLLYNGSKMSWVNWKEGSIKTVPANLRILAVHSQSLSNVKVIAYHKSTGTLGVYKLSPLESEGSITLEKALLKGISALPEVYLEWLEEQPQFNTLKAVQESAKLTDIVIHLTL